MKPIIEVENLKKSFGSVKAVDDITFAVEAGSFFAFLGLNGAGKTTTINILCSLLMPDSGTVIVDGHDLKTDDLEIRRKIGIVFQGSILDARLSVRDNLKIRAGLYGIFGENFRTRLGELTELFDLHDILKRSYGKLSGGQKRRVDIARALLHSPSVLILDEPTTGLDPQSRRQVWNILKKLNREQQVTLFLTTHYMEEAEAADKVVILDAGKIAAEGTPIDLKNIYSGNYILLYQTKNSAVEAALSDREFSYNSGIYKIKVATSLEAAELLAAYPEIFTDFEVIKGNMDDVFLNVTGKNLREVSAL